jgi:hypothetical protein
MDDRRNDSPEGATDGGQPGEAADPADRTDPAQSSDPTDPADLADRGDPAHRAGPALWSRRRVLGLARAGGLAGASYLLLQGVLDDGERPPAAASPQGDIRTSTGAPPSTTTTQPEAPPGMARWSDPATWGGEVPGVGNVAVVERPVLLDVDAEVDGVRIAPRGELRFDPAASRTLRSRGNVDVEGTLRMRPSDAPTTHRLVFTRVDESAFVGGHTHSALATDRGLWVLGTGVLDLAGTAKTAWTHAAGPLEAGATTLRVDDATGWKVGDEIVVTPTEPATVDDHVEHHDRRVIAAVDGNRVTLDQALAHPHPEVTVRDGVTYRAEVLNLSRNVTVEGTESGRAHILVLASGAQHLAYVGLRHMGPQHDEAGVLGRYPLHFHMVGDGSRGSVVEGAVAYDGGNHAFVAHMSNGVTFRDCVAHDMAEDPYWWDLAPEDDADSVPSDDVTFERCVAHYIRYGGDKYGLAGFQLGAGAGNVARGCVAVAVKGESESSPGYHWASHSRDEHTWVFEDNVAHNNANSGIYFWQNNVPRTVVDRFTVYNCTQGIVAGAYTNLASYRDCTIYGCTEQGLSIVALPGGPPGETITYEGLYVDQAGLTDFAVEIGEHHIDADVETAISRCTFTGGRTAQVGLPTGGEFLQSYRFDDCVFHGNEFWLADDVPASTLLRITDAERGAILVRRVDQGGDARPEWNAAVSPP